MITQTIQTFVHCDAHGCTEYIDVVTDSIKRGMARALKSAEDEGWLVDEVRHYCPKHKPTPPRSGA